MGQELSAKVVDVERDEGDGTLSVDEAASLLGITAHGVRKALREGRLRRCNPPSEHARFTRAEVERFIEGREAGPSTSASDEVQLAQADAVTHLVSQAQAHTEEAWKQVGGVVTELRKSAVDMMRSKDDLIARLLRRIDALEQQRDDVTEALDVLRKARYDEKIADAEATVVKEKGRAAIELGKLFVPALLGRITGDERINNGAFRKLVDSFTHEQRDTLISTLGNVLTADQQMVLMTLFSEWDAKASKEERKSEPPAPATTDGKAG